MDKIENTGGYGVAKVKTMETSRGYFFNGILTQHNKRVGDFEDKGDGGAMTINFDKPEEKTLLLNFLKEHFPEDAASSEPFSTFIATLCDEDELARKIKRMRNRKTFFSLKSERTPYESTLRELGVPYGEKAKKYIEDKYGEDVEAIANELFEIYPDNNQNHPSP